MPKPYALYNCKHADDLYRITKFDADANVESSYLTDGTTCDCPAGVRPVCRHRTMLPLFKASKGTNGNLFYNFDEGTWLGSVEDEPGETIPEIVLSIDESKEFPEVLDLPEGVTMLSLDDPAEVHNAIADAVGEPRLPTSNQPQPNPDRSALRRI